MPPWPASPMDCNPAAFEPAYLNLPGWRCVPVYAVPFSPPAASEPHKLMPSSIPLDPNQWSRQNVFTWLEWCVDSFSLPTVDVENFFMNGRGLCLLKKSDFCERAPRCGDVLYNALQLLLQKNRQTNSESNTTDDGVPPPPTGISASLLQHAAEEKGAFFPMARFNWPRSVSSDFHSVGHVIHEGETQSDADSTTASSPPLQAADDSAAEDSYSPNSKQVSNSHNIRQLNSHYNNGTVENSTDKINVRLLWDFLQQLLNDSQQRYHGCIVWKDKGQGIFKITDPHRLAALWGKQKNHLNMNFDKMSRALRYYYRVRILQKEPGERHCYRFLRHPSELRHCKQRALLARDSENVAHNGIQKCTNVVAALDMSTDVAALDMSIKEEGCSLSNEERE